MSVARGSARRDAPRARRRGGACVEVRFDGPIHGNPFVDVELDGDPSRARRPDPARRRVLRRRRRVRRSALLADVEGDVALRRRARPRARSTASPARSSVTEPARTGRHGPVARRRLPLPCTPTAPGTGRSAPRPTPGRTSPRRCRSRRCATLAELAVHEDAHVRLPEVVPLQRERAGATSPSPGRSRTGSTSSASTPRTSAALEQRIAQLGELGIEADLILFHAYDRWGFADLGPAVDERVPPLRRAPARRVRERVVVDGERVRPAVVEDGGGLGADRRDRRRGGPARAPQLDPQLPPVLRPLPALDHARQRAARRRLPHRGEHRRVARAVGQAGRDRRVRATRATSTRAGATSPARSWCAASGRAPSAAATSATARPTSNEREELGGRRAASSSAQPRADRRSSTASSPSRRRRARAAPLRLGRAVGRRRGRVPRAATSGSTARGSATSCCPTASSTVDVIDTWGMTVEPVPGIHTGVVRVELPGRQYMAVRLRRH